jgi:pyruvate dehydrogenase E1 component alpha subunit
VDPDRYRDREEVQAGRAHDPIPAFASRLIAAGYIDEDGVREIEERVDRDVDEAVKFADESPNPRLEELFDYMYAPDDEGLKNSAQEVNTPSTKGSRDTDVKGEE